MYTITSIRRVIIMKLKLTDKEGNIAFVSGFRRYPMKHEDGTIYVFSYTNKYEKAEQFKNNDIASIKKELQHNLIGNEREWYVEVVL